MVLSEHALKCYKTYAEQSSFFHEHTLHVHKKAFANTTTGKFTQTRQIPRINLQRRLQVFPESGTYRMLFSVEVWTMQMNYVLNLLGCTFAMIFTSKCRTATYSTARDHPFGQLSTFDLGTTTNRRLARGCGPLTVCGARTARFSFPTHCRVRSHVARPPKR